jgi:polysaccharide export outer membrane protein
MRGCRTFHLAAVAVAVLMSGCLHNKQVLLPPPDGTVPRELDKTTLPPYVIEPPDILYIEVLIPPLTPEKQPYSTALPPQPVQGQFLVRPDGTVGLGIYGTVHVTGLTCDQARDRIREFVSKAADKDPKALQVTVDVAAYNSKVYYVITDGAGFGEQVYAFPIVGSETVMDALARIGGVPPVGSTKRIWLARRSPHAGQPEQMLPVDWAATTQQGVACTNYQVLPGDRIYVQAQKLISIDNAIAKTFAPIERLLGVTLLGSSTYNSISGRFANNRGF